MDKDTPLHWVASEGHVAVVKILVQEGADVNAYNKDMNTPLLVACAEVAPLCLFLSLAPLFSPSPSPSPLRFALFVPSLSSPSSSLLHTPLSHTRTHTLSLSLSLSVSVMYIYTYMMMYHVMRKV